MDKLKDIKNIEIYKKIIDEIVKKEKETEWEIPSVSLKGFKYPFKIKYIYGIEHTETFLNLDFIEEVLKEYYPHEISIRQTNSLRQTYRPPKNYGLNIELKSKIEDSEILDYFYNMEKVEDVKDFEVVCYTIGNNADSEYKKWSDGIRVHLKKGNTILELNGNEVEKLINSLPKTAGGLK